MEKSTSPIEALLSLSNIDTEIAVLRQKEIELQKKNSQLEKEVSAKKSFVDKQNTQIKEITQKLKFEEDVLSSEQKKIIERRKQINDLGGAKSAKLIEREVDVASRSLQEKEEKALVIMEQLEELKKKAEVDKKQLDDLQLNFEKEASEFSQTMEDFKQRAVTLQERRANALAKVDEKNKTLYQRINVKYPADPVSTIVKGMCGICYKSVPAQQVNQLMTGAIMQCSGCSRILINPIENKE